MTAYRIRASGCDDSTHVDLDLTDDEAAAVRKVAEAITEASQFGCMPVLSIKPAAEEPDDD